MALVTRTRRIAAVLAIAAGTALATPAVAFAQTPYPGGTTPDTVKESGAVLSNTVETPRATEVLGVQVGGLAVTGGDVLGLAAIGGGLVLGGTVLVRRSRRTAAAA